jgi:hypothetical protein
MRADFPSLIGELMGNLDNLKNGLQPQWHPLGFVSCVVPLKAIEGTIRLHYWPSHERRVKNPDWPIHTHSYKLTSLVLKGWVCDVQYKAIPGNDFTIYEVSYNACGSEIIRTSATVSLDEVENIRREAGAVYVVERGRLHQTQVPMENSAVTIVHLNEHGSEAPKVLGSREADKYPYVRENFPKFDFWKVVEEAMSGVVIRPHDSLRASS